MSTKIQVTHIPSTYRAIWLYPEKTYFNRTFQAIHAWDWLTPDEAKFYEPDYMTDERMDEIAYDSEQDAELEEEIDESI